MFWISRLTFSRIMLVSSSNFSMRSETSEGRSSIGFMTAPVANAKDGWYFDFRVYLDLECCQGPKNRLLSFWVEGYKRGYGQVEIHSFSGVSMRFLLIVLGLIGTVAGAITLESHHESNRLFLGQGLMLGGLYFIGLGLATWDIINAIKDQRRQP